MPNWCYNVLTARGTKEEIDSFLAKTTKANQSTDFADMEPLVFDFNSIIPMPNNVFRGNIGQKEQDECRAQGIPNWYDWSISHWGTKWNACHTAVIRDADDKVSISFSTAWSYPLPVMNEMIDMYPNIDFDITSHEESDAFVLQHTREGIEEGENRYYADGKAVEYNDEKDKWIDADGNEYDEYDESGYWFPSDDMF